MLMNNSYRVCNVTFLANRGLMDGKLATVICVGLPLGIISRGLEGVEEGAEAVPIRARVGGSLVINGAGTRRACGGSDGNGGAVFSGV